MNEQPKKRFRFQMHLSTAIVLMFVAGGLMWLNIFNSDTSYGKRIGCSVYLDEEALLRCESNDAAFYGWPFPSVFRITGLGPGPKVTPLGYYVDWSFVLIDLAIALVILLAVLFVCEMWIQWRQTKLRRVAPVDH